LGTLVYLDVPFSLSPFVLQLRTKECLIAQVILWSGALGTS